MATVARTIRWGAREPGAAAEVHYQVFGRNAAGVYGELVSRSNAGVSEERSGCYKAEIAGWNTLWRDWAVYWDRNNLDPELVEKDPFGADLHHVNGKPATPANGGGAFVVTVTVTNSVGGAAIVGASVRMTDASGSYEAATNGSGVATFNLDSSTYALGIFKEGYLYAPTNQVITGAGNIAAQMTQIAISAPADPEQTTAYTVTRDGKGQVKPGVTLTFRLVDPAGNSGGAFDRRNFTATSDAVGLLQVALMKNSSYQQKHEKGEWSAPFTTGNAGTFALPEILSEFGS